MTSPFIQKKANTGLVMFDVIIALVPLVIIALYAFGNRALMVLAGSVAACLITDVALGYFLLSKNKLGIDGSAVITGLLLAFTLSPLTPLDIVVFGGIAAILFGKILWGGLGKNTFNPALVGRECMTAFFPGVMSTGSIWNTNLYIAHRDIDICNIFNSTQANEQLGTLIYNPSGALGEYSLLAISLGAIYLLWRNRISWHIPVAFLSAFFLAGYLFPLARIAGFSLGGLLLGAVYMATDMPTSPTHRNGKLYFGAMLGGIVALMIASGVNNVYLSYGILIMNAFSKNIDETIRPVAWGHNRPKTVRQWETAGKLTLHIFLISFAIISLHKAGWIHWLLYGYVAYMLWQFYYETQYKTKELF